MSEDVTARYKQLGQACHVGCRDTGILRKVMCSLHLMEASAGSFPSQHPYFPSCISHTAPSFAGPSERRLAIHGGITWQLPHTAVSRLDTCDFHLCRSKGALF